MNGAMDNGRQTSLLFAALLVAGCAVGAREAADGSTTPGVDASADQAASTDARQGDAVVDGPQQDVGAGDGTALVDAIIPDAPCAPDCKGKCPGAKDGCGSTCQTNGCVGCCNGPQCRMGTFDTACGVAGGACSDCTGKSSVCGTGVCKLGKCVGAAKKDGTACTGGTCRGGACCTGCWDGKACQTGAAVAKCGIKGAKCLDCDDKSPCLKDTCKSGVCNYGATAKGTPCSLGTCNWGKCCGGCWSGKVCLAGTATSACGKQGADCAPCTSPDPCKTGACASGGCQFSAKKDLSACPGGVCIAGSCCSGCGSQILLVALNHAYTGNLGGISGADNLCAKEALSAGFKGVFKAFLSGGGRLVKDLIPPCCGTKVPVVNTQGQLLYASWSQIFSSPKWGGGWFLYTFDGKKVDEGTGAVPDWVDADHWHGSNAIGTASGGLTCLNWTSGSDLHSGTNGELDMQQLLGQETWACNQTLAVVCVRVSMQ